MQQVQNPVTQIVSIDGRVVDNEDHFRAFDRSLRIPEDGVVGMCPTQLFGVSEADQTRTVYHDQLNLVFGQRCRGVSPGCVNSFGHRANVRPNKTVH
jgi:hypothetical protein